MQASTADTTMELVDLLNETRAAAVMAKRQGAAARSDSIGAYYLGKQEAYEFAIHRLEAILRQGAR